MLDPWHQGCTCWDEGIGSSGGSEPQSCGLLPNTQQRRSASPSSSGNTTHQNATPTHPHHEEVAHVELGQGQQRQRGEDVCHRQLAITKKSHM